MRSGASVPQSMAVRSFCVISGEPHGGDGPADRAAIARETGLYLHLGSLVAAVGSRLEALRHGGAWHLRVEDLDTPRIVAGATERILATLRALAFEWPSPVEYQSRHAARYAAALDAIPAGAEAHWLSPGFPRFDGKPPAFEAATSSLLREFDADLASDATLTVLATDVVDGLDDERIRLVRIHDFLSPERIVSTIRQHLGLMG